jgi:hypothetical protein
MSFGLRVGGDLLEWGDEVRVLELEAIPLFSNIHFPLKVAFNLQITTRCLSLQQAQTQPSNIR